MALEYGFTDNEKLTYYQQDKVYSSFGKDTTNDFVALYVYGLNDNLLATKILALNEVEIDSSGNFTDLDIGQHLRDLGFRQGDYKVTYKFLRRLAGRPRTIFVTASGQLYTGPTERKVVNGEIRHFQFISDEEKGNAEPVEVYIKEQKYVISDVAPDRMECKVELDSMVNTQEYVNDFKEMNSLIEYSPISSNNSGLIKFDSKDGNVLEFDIDPQDRGFTQNMIGGQIVIPSMYKITGEEDTTNEDLEEIEDEGVEENYNKLTQQDLIELARQGDEDADNELQERAADSDY